MKGKSIFVILFFCVTSPIYFAQQLQVQLKDLSKEAEIILAGTVTQQTSNWNEDKSKIYTIATIKVEEYIKGTIPGNTVSVKYLGGEVGEVGEIYSHMPRFITKEEVLVFLQKDKKTNEYKVCSGEDGKISLIIDPQSGELVTSSNIRVSSLKTQIKNYINE